MTPEELTKRIESLQQELSELKAGKDFQLKYPLDEETKRIITQTISSELPRIWWDEIFFLSSVFESVDRFSVTAAVTISDTGLEMSTSAGSAAASLLQETGTPIAIENETYFSNTVTVVDVSEVNFDATILTGTGYVSMQINEGAIVGVCNDGTTSSEVSIGTAVDNGAYLLELNYFPGDRVDFYVDGTLEGSVTSNLPPLTSDVTTIVEYGLEPESGGATATSCNINYFSILQRRKNQ